MLLLHSLLSSLEDPQCELLQKCSCLNICKIPHLLHLVPLMKVWTNLQVFDDGLCQVLKRILCCSVSERSQFHSSLPYDLDNFGSFSLFALPCCLNGKLSPSSVAATQQSWSCGLWYTLNSWHVNSWWPPQTASAHLNSLYSGQFTIGVDYRPLSVKIWDLLLLYLC